VIEQALIQAGYISWCSPTQTACCWHLWNHPKSLTLVNNLKVSINKLDEAIPRLASPGVV
jgi:hypothetical protein